jgi:hypothetical protein
MAMMLNRIAAAVIASLFFIQKRSPQQRLHPPRHEKLRSRSSTRMGVMITIRLSINMAIFIYIVIKSSFDVRHENSEKRPSYAHFRNNVLAHLTQIRLGVALRIWCSRIPGRAGCYYSLNPTGFTTKTERTEMFTRETCVSHLRTWVASRHWSTPSRIAPQSLRFAQESATNGVMTDKKSINVIH